jgi:hypothetical protein
MVFEEIINFRIKQGCEYLKLLDKALFERGYWNWTDKYKVFCSRSLAQLEKYILIHPYFYQDFGESFNPRGSRDFSSESDQQYAECVSERFWGYDCFLRKGSTCESDHVFPYSYGGPTVPGNKKFLCKEHNKFKSNDVHLYPWEEPEPNWLSELIHRIAEKKRQSGKL